MVLSVQFAADSTSAAAPRTVLQAESAMHVPSSNVVINFDFMSTLPYMYETTWRQLLPLSTVWPLNECLKKCPAEAGPARHFSTCKAASVQQVLPSIVFSVQFATEFTSRAAPRTVLQAAVASAAVISAAVTNFWTMDCSS